MPLCKIHPPKTKVVGLDGYLRIRHRKRLRPVPMVTDGMKYYFRARRRAELKVHGYLKIPMSKLYWNPPKNRRSSIRESFVMPSHPGKRSKAKRVSRKIRKLKKEGKPQKQAVAISLSMANRRKKSSRKS